MEPLLAARMQMAMTLGWHIITASFGVGLPLLLFFVEWRYLKTGDEGWKTLAQRWSKAFAVLFAVGAVSGTVLSFELGLLWPEFMGTFGGVIALPFTMEGFAFFLEAIFVGIYLYTWDHLPPRVHWLCALPIAVSGCVSAWFVVTANAWMNVPQGFTLVDGVVTEADPIAAMLNPATGSQTAHMIIAAYMVTGFMVASYYAWRRLRGDDTPYHRRAMTVGLVLGAVFAPLQGLSGDWAATVVAETQPIKLAAMEGQFETMRGAPLRIGGLPDEVRHETTMAIEIPKMLSWLAYRDFNAEVKGLNAFPEGDWPPVAVTHMAFQIMVGIGTALIALSLWAAISLVRSRKLPESRLFLWLTVASGPLVVIALEAGWTVTEVGRQPWIAQGYMRTSEAVTQAPGVTGVFFVTMFIYLLLTVGAIAVLRSLERKPLPEDTTHGA